MAAAPVAHAAPMTDRRPSWTPGVTLVGCCALWGLNQVAAKATLAEIPPLLQAGAALAGRGAAAVAWSRCAGMPVWPCATARLARRPAGRRLFAAEFACIFVGLQYTSASRMAVFMYLAPFVVALGMPFIARSERLTAGSCGPGAGLRRRRLGFAEGLHSTPAAGPRQWLGDALGVAAAVLWGLTTLVLRGSRLATALPEKTLLYQLGVSGLAADWRLVAGRARPGRRR
jgi:drug/metabolite transporter (DMT)-like permease